MGQSRGIEARDMAALIAVAMTASYQGNGGVVDELFTKTINASLRVGKLAADRGVANA